LRPFISITCHFALGERLGLQRLQLSPSVLQFSAFIQAWLGLRLTGKALPGKIAKGKYNGRHEIPDRFPGQMVDDMPAWPKKAK
jgi:hypothetical protein